MQSSTIGISDIQLYVPRPWISSDTLVGRRSAEDPDLEMRLKRAVEYTGQRSFHFPGLREDSATMAAEAGRELLLRRGTAAGLRYLVTGTETTVDHSKPVASYTAGMLDASGLDLPVSHTTFQVQHACAGGTLSLFSIGALLAAGGRPDEYGMAVCTDIARYESGSTGEVTQGAGAVALLVEPNPSLIEIDLSTVGYASRDVDDFFRPFGVDEARVKGQYSIRCYRSALTEALEDHASRIGEDPASLLESTDHFVLHVPYYSLPLDSMRMLLKKHLGYRAEEADAFLRERLFQTSIEPARDIGNLYSGSMFMSLITLLRERHVRDKEKMAGSRILFASYGSGNTMAVFSGRIAPGAAGVVSRWQEALRSPSESAWEAYLSWKDKRGWDASFNEVLGGLGPESETGFYLHSIREDGFREYRHKG